MSKCISTVHNNNYDYGYTNAMIFQTTRLFYVLVSTIGVWRFVINDNHGKIYLILSAKKNHIRHCSKPVRVINMHHHTRLLDARARNVSLFPYYCVISPFPVFINLQETRIGLIYTRCGY